MASQVQSTLPPLGLWIKYKSLGDELRMVCRATKQPLYSSRRPCQSRGGRGQELTTWHQLPSEPLLNMTLTELLNRQSFLVPTSGRPSLFPGWTSGDAQKRVSRRPDRFEKPKAGHEALGSTPTVYILLLVPLAWRCISIRKPSPTSMQLPGHPLVTCCDAKQTMSCCPRVHEGGSKALQRGMQNLFQFIAMPWSQKTRGRVQCVTRGPNDATSLSGEILSSRGK